METFRNIKKLYIIGNGFDLFHGIPSSYREFGEFLRENDHKVYHHAVEYLHADEISFWSEFEENLAYLDTDSLLEVASEFLVGYGAEDWSDAYHHDYQYEIEQVVSSLSSGMAYQFSKWIQQLPIPSASTIPQGLLNLDKNALFLSFNYTPTLTTLYGVPNENILHIHGTARDSSLVLGHGWAEQEEKEQEDWCEPDDVDVRIQEGDEIIKSYFKKTFKPTDSIIETNRNFFQSLKGLEQIFIFGHSLSDVDLPYFEEVKRHIMADDVRWKVSYYDDIDRIKERFGLVGIPNHLADFVRLEEFRS